MASNRASAPDTTDASASGSRPTAESLRLEPEPPVKEKTVSDTAPRAGRTGGLGARAERPADGRARKVTSSREGESARRGKPPSPAAGKKGATATALPKPVRDSTG